MLNVRKALKVLTLALAFTTSLTTIANAAPLVGLIFGSAFAATIGGQILGIVFGVVGSYIFSAIAGALFPSTDTTKTDPQQVQYGERVPRSMIFGTTLIGGHFLYINEYNNSKQLQMVFGLGEFQHSGILQVKVDGKLLDTTSISTSGNNEHYNYSVDTYSTTLFKLRMHDGRVGQAADSSLVSNSTGWTSAKKYSDIAYAVVDLKSDKEKWSGIPDLQWVVQGAKLYDPRKDTTAGGSGSHRFGTPSTWEYSANPAVQAYHFLRGFYFNGRRVLGVGYAAAELDLSTFVAAMNVCDEDVIDPNGDHRPRYECHMQFSDTDQFSSVLDKLVQAMGGSYAEVAGAICIWAGKAQSSVLTITDDDLLDDEPFTFNPGKPGEVVMTGIQGTYIHSIDFTPTPFTSIEPPEFLNPNWYPHTQEVNYDQVRNAHQAFCLSKQTLYANQKQASATIALDFNRLVVQLNDWITWSSSTSIIGERLWRVVQVAYSLSKRRMYLTLQETDADVFDDDATPDDVVEPIRVVITGGYQTTVTGLAITPLALTGGAGEVFPALEFTYDAITDPAIQAVEINYRVAADGFDPAGPWFKVTDWSIYDGEVRATNGVTPGKVHEAYARLITVPGREVTDSSMATAAFPTIDTVVSAVVDDGTITILKLNADLQNIVGLLTSDGEGSVFTLIRNLQEEIERQANAGYTNNMQVGRSTQLLARQTTNAAAAVIQESYVRLTEDTALAVAISEVEASIGDGIASGYLQLAATVDGMTSTATITAKVRAQLGDTFSEAAWILEAQADGVGGSTLSGFFVKVDTFAVMSDTDDPTQAFSFEDGELKVEAARMGRINSPDGVSYIDLGDPDGPVLHFESA